jgi:hypothetical protein
MDFMKVEDSNTKGEKVKAESLAADETDIVTISYGRCMSDPTKEDLLPLASGDKSPPLLIETLSEYFETRACYVGHR